MVKTMKSDKLLKELKVKRKVTYDEYVAYLKGKSEDEIAGIYIELQVKLEELSRLSPVLCIGGSSLMGLGFLESCRDMDINLNDLWQVINIIGASLSIAYLMLVITNMIMLYLETNLNERFSLLIVIKNLGQIAPSVLKIKRNVVNRERRNKKCGTITLIYLEI